MAVEQNDATSDFSRFVKRMYSYLSNYPKHDPSYSMQQLGQKMDLLKATFDLEIQFQDQILSELSHLKDTLWF